MLSKTTILEDSILGRTYFMVFKSSFLLPSEVNKLNTVPRQVGHTSDVQNVIDHFINILKSYSRFTPSKKIYEMQFCMIFKRIFPNNKLAIKQDVLDKFENLEIL